MLSARAREFPVPVGRPRLAGSGLLVLVALSTVVAGWLILRGRGLVGLGGIGFVALYVAILLRWQRGAYGLFVYLPFAGVMTLVLYPWQGPALLHPTLYKDWFLVLPAYAGFFGSVLLGRERPPRIGRLLGGLLLAFSALVIVQMANPGVANLLMALIGAKVWLFYIPLCFLTVSLVVSRRELTFLLRLLVALAILPCAIGLAEFALGRLYGHVTAMEAIYRTLAPEAQQGFGVYEVSGGLLPRGTPSTFTFVTQYFGFLLAMLVPCYVVGRTDPSAGWRRFGMWTLAVVALAALLTGARAAFVFVPLLLLLAFGLDRGLGGLLRAAALIGGTIAGAVLLMGMRARALFDHVAELFVLYAGDTAYGGLVQALTLAPLGRGTGTNTGPARYAFFDPTSFVGFENYYAKAAYELGIPGLLLVLGLFSALLWRGFQTRRRLNDPALRVCASVLLAFQITLALNSFKGGLLDLDPINVYFWLFAGVLAKLPRLQFAPNQLIGEITSCQKWETQG